MAIESQINTVVLLLSFIGLLTVTFALGSAATYVLEKWVEHSRQAETLLPKAIHNIR